MINKNNKKIIPLPLIYILCAPFIILVLALIGSILPGVYLISVSFALVISCMMLYIRIEHILYRSERKFLYVNYFTVKFVSLMFLVICGWSGFISFIFNLAFSSNAGIGWGAGLGTVSIILGIQFILINIAKENSNAEKEKNFVE